MGVNALLHKVLDEVGIKPERYSLQWASAAEAPRFVKLITRFTEDIKKLGPLGEAEGLEPDVLQARLAKALEVMEDRKVRMFFGNATKGIRKDAVFTQKHISAVIDDKMTKTVQAAIHAEPKVDTPAAAKAEKEEKPAAKKAAAAPKRTAKKAPAKKKTAAAKKTAQKATVKKATTAAKKKK